MLSSTMVTVLAPQWSSRLRRTKRFDGSGYSEAQVDLQEAANTLPNQQQSVQGHVDQHGIKNVLTHGSNIPRRVPFLSSRSYTVGWSSKSDPSSLDFTTRKDIIQTVSLDSGALSPSAFSAMPSSPLSLNLNETRNPQERQSSLSSKPTTSTVLLSSRRINLNETNSCQAPVVPEVKPTSLSSSHNSNGQDRSKTLLSPSTLSGRTIRTGPVVNPVGSSHRENKFLFLTSPTNRSMKENPFTQQSQPVHMTQTSLRSSEAAAPGKSHLERHQDFENANIANSLQKNPISTTRYFNYDHSAPLKTYTPPRRTDMKSTHWWKQVSQESSSPLSVKNNIGNKKDNLNTNYLSATDNKRLASYTQNNSDNKNTQELVCKVNTNLSLKTQSTESEQAATQQYGLNVDKREPQKPQSMPDCWLPSKLSTVPAQTKLRHTNAPDKNDERNTLFIAHEPAMTSNPPADSFGKYNGSPPKTTLASTSQSKTKLPHYHEYTSISRSQPSLPQTTSEHSSVLNTKNTSSFQSGQFSSNTNIYSSAGQTSVFTSKSNVSPLGFKRGYVFLPKPFFSKPVTSLSPTDNTNKMRASSISASPTISSATPQHSPSTLSPPVPSTITSPVSITASSVLTPPTTPVNPSPTSETSPPKLKGIVYNSLERDPKKKGKRERRVTWQDSVDVKCSESVNVDKPDPVQVQSNSPAPTKLSQGSPIFSYLQSGIAEGGGSPVYASDRGSLKTEMGKGGKFRSFSTDCVEVETSEHDKSKHKVGDTMISDQGKKGPITTKQEPTLSVESGVVQRRYSSPLSLPSDFLSGYRHRYSTPPYSSLKSTRQTQGELKTSPQMFVVSQSSPQPSSNAELCASSCKPHLSTVQTFSMPLQIESPKQENLIANVSDTDGVKINNSQNHTQEQPNNQIHLLDNRFHVSSQSHEDDGEHSFSSTYVTETLVYGIKPKADTATETPRNTAPTSSQHNTNTLVSVNTEFDQQSHSMQSTERVEQSCMLTDNSCSESRSTKSEPSLDETNNTTTKGSVQAKNRFYSVEINNEQTPMKSRFSLKRSVSSPSSSLAKTDSERVKNYNKVDQMINKLKQKFNPRRAEDELPFPWKWKRNSLTPSVSGSSDISDVSTDSAKTLEDQTQEKETLLKHKPVKMVDTKRKTDNRYTLVQALSVGETKAGKDLSTCSESVVQEKKRDDPSSCATPQTKMHLTVHGPDEQSDAALDNRAQQTSTSQLLSFSNDSIDGSHSPNTIYPNQCKKSTPSPRSPFSPFSSLSPVSPLSTAEVFDDNVFYSPKPPRRGEPSSPFQPGEGIRLGSSRRSRASTGPPTPSPGKDKEPVTSSYADLKYGIEPGRTFSVSSVLSSRPARPGRISTGTRFMSVGDLSQRALSYASNGRELCQDTTTPYEEGPFHSQPNCEPHMSYSAYDAGKLRSRSLPRSLTQCLAKWSSGVPPSQSSTGNPSKPGLARSPSMNICHFSWDTEGPPTPPPTPPLSPVTRRMSKAPSLPSPVFTSSPDAVHQANSQSSRALRPSRSYVSSLDTFDESSDSSSDTTTDDEYYIDSDGDDEKETEL
ncbi:PREDICTED: signaling mucin MSB2-like [Cyprinodon variegatus]|uniref:signaling mucin MSB2-like n=1 Tax=Cyprinodon variegatus TaxID=28743 RepID=UPI0007429C42|nr:PREDICTED: signaling mucin MSB2-like [Cyprinodon variegatus]